MAGEAGRGVAGRGEASQARLGTTWLGLAWSGMASLERRGTDGLGVAGTINAPVYSGAINLSLTQSMTRFSLIAEYKDGSVEDLTSNDGSTADDILRDVALFVEDGYGWSKLTIMREESNA